MTTELLFPLQHFSFFRIKERNYEALCQVFSQMIYRFLIGGLMTKPLPRENPDALPSDMCYNVEPALI